MKILSNTDMENLLAEKPFATLTQEERNAVLQSMGEEEYERLHSLLMRSRAALKNSPPPDPAIRQRLLAALRNRQATPQPEAQKPPALLVRMFRYRVPAWQAAAAVAVLLVAHVTFKNSPSPEVRTETLYVHDTDTIYKEVALPAGMDTATNVPPNRVNVKPRLPRSLMAKEPEIIAVADSSHRMPGYPDLPDTLPGFHLQLEAPRGQSANDVKDLWLLTGDVF